MANDTKVILKFDGKEYELPLVEGSEKERAIDITTLRAQTGLVTLDAGYMNTGACQSSVTFLDGEKGILRYRGYPIEQLAEKSTFVEVCHLLIYGKLPTQKELERFRTSLTRHTMLHEDMKRFYDGFPRDAHPMATLSSAVSTLSTFYQGSSNFTKPLDMELSIWRLLAKLPTIAAFSYKKSIGQPFIYPTNSLDYSSNFLKMMFAVPAEEYRVEPEVAKALDLLLILHADHEQNCSTSTVRLVGSSRANLYASVSAGILNKLGIHDPLLDIAKRLEETALSDDYFVSRKLYPNVDFYSGIIYRAIGIPTNMFTVMFAIGRLPGWIAQWKEMLDSPNAKIGRPRQIYTGPEERNYVPIHDRRA